jgi:hypothetical protein
VASFGKKNIDYLIAIYANLLKDPYKKGVKRAYFSAIMFGYSQLMRFLFIAVMFYIAAVIIEKHNLDSQIVFTGVYVIFVGGIGSGTAMGQAPSYSRA